MSPAKAKSAAYREDLAYIHDVGFGGFAAGAAPWLLALLKSHALTDGLVIDLGCGSGIWARELSMAGFGVLGYDISEAMIAIAAKRVPRGEFHARPFLGARLRPCVAVTALGEVFNYLFDRRNTQERLAAFFSQVHAALRPGGLFVFDVATPGREPTGQRQAYREGSDWACLFEAREDSQARSLTRRISTFRRVGTLYRRDDEVHRLRLYDRQEMTAALREAGFRVRTVRDYGKTVFPPGYVGFVAQKA
ncbi:MAG: class I SAM-dependent methyltransferase [Pirellulales bacterium]